MKMPAIALAGACLFSTGAAAADCAPLKLLSTIKMTPAGGDPDDVRLIPVGINDQTRMFLFDTGGAISQITRKAAEDMKLEIINSNIEMYDVNGRASRKAVTLDKFLVGRMLFTNVRMPVSPMPGGDGMDGILSSNMLVNYDIDLDFPGNTMNYISPDHCAGNVMYWKADTVGVVPIKLVNNTRITVTVTLDGQTFDAFIDTGATRSVMSEKVAKYFFRVPLGADGDTPVKSINGDGSLTGYLHNFGKLSFGGVTVEKPQIMILEDRMNMAGDRSQQTGNRAMRNNADITLPQLVIGMNMLKDMHVYIAFAEHRLYVTQTAAAGAAATGPAGH